MPLIKIIIIIAKIFKAFKIKIIIIIKKTIIIITKIFSKNTITSFIKKIYLNQ